MRNEPLRVIQVFGTLERAGAQSTVINTCKLIDENTIHIDYLVNERTDCGYENEVEARGSRIIVAPSARQVGLLGYINLRKRLLLDNGPYDAIHCHMNALSGYTLFAAKLAGIPVRISHSHSTNCGNGIKERAGKILLQLCATKRVACGVEAGEALFGNRQFSVLHNGIDISKFIDNYSVNKKLIMKELGLDSSAFTICHVGRFITIKNHGFIIQIAKQLKQLSRRVQFILLGDGPEYASVVKQAKEHGVDDIVHFVGLTDAPERYLSISDLLILPSEYEGIPVSVIEAQSAGLKCLLSQNVSREVDLGLGLVEFLPLEASSWIDEICQLINGDRLIVNPQDILTALIERGYSARHNAAEYCKLYFNSSK